MKQSAQAFRFSDTLLLMAAGGGVLLAAILARYLIGSGLTWPCPARVLLGLPCLTCGSTRAFAALAELDLGGALRWNPLMTVALLGLVLVPLVRRRVRLSGRVGWPVLICIAALNWVYLFLTLPR